MRDINRSTSLISAIRKKYPNIPIHVHSHDTAGIATASMIACALAGADVIDVAIDSAFPHVANYYYALMQAVRYVRLNIATIHGCSLHGFGANNFGNWYPIR